MLIEENYPLRQHTTFGIESSARYFGEFSNTEDLREVLADPRFKGLPLLILGGGSNILFTQDFEGLVLRNHIKGIRVLSEDEDYALVKAGAGEIWHELVMFCIEHGFGGVENLSLIPGSTGAGPMQNIGAYGVELKEVFDELEALEIATGKVKVFSKEECRFGYRNSIFKQEAKNCYVITSVTLRLSRKPILNTTYGAIEDELKAMGIMQPTIREVSQAVINIRRSKLPDPALIGNAGSFFKNPEISTAQFEELKSRFPAIVGYKTANGVKAAAGWLIEQCGWKGKRIGNAGVHQNQALVLVNYGGAEGKDVFAIARMIRESVMEKFGIELEMEVNIV